MNSSKPKAKLAKGPSPSLPLRQRSSFTSGGLLSIEFEIRGKVQGVHFRKYTQEKAKSLKLRGWCQNTAQGTVRGCIEGERLKIDMMKDWLRRTGSPKSKITFAEFKNIKALKEYSQEDFIIIK